jgi:hypothetical protein
VKPSALIWIAVGILIGILLSGAAFAARPGEVGDPLISLSYLQTAGSFKHTAINKGEILKISPGQEFILLDGRIRLECAGEFMTYDLTKGKSHKNPGSVEEGSLVVIVGNSNVSVIAESAGECLVRGYTLE